MNTAKRICDLLEIARREGDGAKVWEVWAKTFGIPKGAQNKVMAEIAMRLALLHGQIEFLSAQMGETEIPEKVYGPPLKQVEAAISSQALSSQWKAFKARITPEVMLALRYNAALLGAQEQPIDEKELASLIEEINHLERMLADSQLAPAVLSLIQNQIDEIRKALNEYRIRGATAVKDVVRKAAGELIEKRQVLEEGSGSEEVSRLAEIWRRVINIGDATTRVSGAIQSGKYLWGLIEQALGK